MPTTGAPEVRPGETCEQVFLSQLATIDAVVGYTTLDRQGDHVFRCAKRQKRESPPIPIPA